MMASGAKPAKTASMAGRSRMSASTKVRREAAVLSPVSVVTIWRTRSRAFALELDRLSTTTTLYPRSSSSTQVWLPMKPAPPVTRMVVS